MCVSLVHSTTHEAIIHSTQNTLSGQTSSSMYKLKDINNQGNRLFDSKKFLEVDLFIVYRRWILCIWWSFCQIRRAVQIEVFHIWNICWRGKEFEIHLFQCISSLSFKNVSRHAGIYVSFTFFFWSRCSNPYSQRASCANVNPNWFSPCFYNL